MSLSTATFTLGAFPYGVDNTVKTIRFNGVTAIAAGTYPASGVPISAFSNPTGYMKSPFMAELESPVSGWIYKYDPTTQGIRIFETSQPSPIGGYPSALVAGSFTTISANWGTGASVAVTGNQTAFTCTITSVVSGAGANPTLVLTFPAPMAQPPIYTVSRGDAVAEAGYFEFTSSTTTTATFTFVGTPANAHVYVLNAHGRSIAYPVTQLVTAGTITLASVAAGTGVYTGTVTGGGSNNFVGLYFTVSGFTNAANNGTFPCTANNTTTLTLTNPASVTESAAATATAGSWVASSGFGTSPIMTLSSNSVQGSFVLTITAETTTAANPSVTLTFPAPYAYAPTFICSRGDTLADAGYWVFSGSTTTTATFTFVGTPTATHVYKLVALAFKPNSQTSLTTAATVASSGFGTSPVLSVAGTQNAFVLSVTAKATTGANPTITLTFPIAYIAASQFVCCRTDSLSDTGYWAVQSTSTTQAVFEFVGTPTANHVYGLAAAAQVSGAGLSELTVGQNIPESVLDDLIVTEMVCTRT